MDENSSFSSLNSDLKEIWSMRNSVKNQLKEVELKLTEARKSVYLPSNDDDVSFRPSTSGLNYQPQPTMYSRPTETSSSNFADDFRRPDITFSSSLANERVSNQAFDPFELSARRRHFDAHQPLRHLSVREQAKIYKVEDFLHREQPFADSSHSTNVYDGLSLKLLEIKSQTGAIRKEIAQNGVRYDEKYAQTSSREEFTPAAASIDKQPTSGRTPRVYSMRRSDSIPANQLRSIEPAHSSKTASNVAKVEKIRRKYSNGTTNTEIRSAVSSVVENGGSPKKRRSLTSASSATSTTISSDSSARTEQIRPPVIDASKTDNPSTSVPLKKPAVPKFNSKSEQKLNGASHGSENKSIQVKTRRSYDSEEIRRYMAKKRQERKEASTSKPTAVSNIEKVRHYDQEMMQDYVRQQKVQRRNDVQRAKEKMENAKLAQKEKFSEMLNAQRAVQNVPLLELLLNANNFKRRRSPSNEAAVSNERVVQLIREKYENSGPVTTGASIFLRPDVLPTRDDGRRVLYSTSNLDGDRDRISVVSLGSDIKVNGVIEPSDRYFDKYDDDGIDEYNIVNTIIKKNRVHEIDQSSPSKRRRVVTSQPKPHVVVPRLNLGDDSDTSISTKFDNKDFVDLPRRPSPQKFTTSMVVSSTEDEDVITERSIQPSPSVSSLTLSTSPDDVQRRSSKTSSLTSTTSVSVINRATPPRRSQSVEEDRVSPSALQMQVVAGLNYLQVIQESLRQVSSVGQITVAQQNAAVVNQILMTEHQQQRNQQRQRDLEQVRLNTEQQRATLEAQRTNAEERRMVEAEMSENQRRLLETIIETNARLAENHRERNSDEYVAKIAADAATSAVLNALKQQQRETFVSPPKSFADSTTSTRSEEESSSKATEKATALSSSSSEENSGKKSEKSLKKVAKSEDIGLKKKPTSAAFVESNSIVSEEIIEESLRHSSSIVEELLSNGFEHESIRSSLMIKDETDLVTDDEDRSNHVSRSVITSSAVQTAVDSSAADVSEKISTVIERDSSKSSNIESEIKTENGRVSEESISSKNSSQTTSSSHSIGTKNEKTKKSLEKKKSTSITVSEVVEARSSSTSKEQTSKPNKSSSMSVSATKASSSNAGGSKKSKELSESSSDSSASSDVDNEAKKLKLKKVNEGKKRETTKILHDFLRVNGTANFDDSVTSLSISDMTTMESRIQALKSELIERKQKAEQLKQEYKRRTKQRFRNTEESLTKQLQAYDTFIEQTSAQLVDLERAGGRPSTPPKIMTSPRPSDAETPPSPRRKLKSALSSPRSSSTSRATSEEKSVALENKTSRNRNVPDEISTSSTLTKSAAKSPKVVIPPLKLDGKERKVEVEPGKNNEGGKLSSDRLPSADVDTTEEVSDVPEDIEDEVVETKSSSEEITSKKLTSTSKDSKTIINGGDSSSGSATPTSNGLRSGSLVDKIHTGRQSDRSDQNNHSSGRSGIQIGLYGGNKLNQEVETLMTPSPKDLIKAIDREEQETLKSRRKEEIFTSLMDKFVSDEVGRCLQELKLRRIKNLEHEKTSNRVEEKPKKIVEVPGKIENISFQLQDATERLYLRIFDDILKEALDDYLRLAASKRAAFISRRDLNKMLELTKIGGSPTSSAEASPRSPRSPSIDKYVSEIYREPLHKTTKNNGGEKSPRNIEVPALSQNELFDDESWMDDDFGLGDFEPSPGKKGSPKSSPRGAELLKFTTDVFSAVPSNENQIGKIVACCVEQVYAQRRLGEPLSDAPKPKDLYVVGGSSGDVDLSLNRRSDAAFRDFMFEYCKEVVGDVYANDQQVTATFGNAWEKSKRLKLSQYCKVTPKSVDELKVVVNGVVNGSVNLNVDVNRAGGRERNVARKKLDRIDEVLLSEMYAEECDWTNYDEEELNVKFELSDSVWKILIDDCFSKDVVVKLTHGRIGV